MMHTGYLFFDPTQFAAPPVPPAAAETDPYAHYLDAPWRDLDRIHVFSTATGWATFIPAWRPESFEADGMTHREPYGVQLHSDRAAAGAHVADYLHSDHARADRDEMIRLINIGGPTYVRRLDNAHLYSGRVSLDAVLGKAAWNLLPALQSCRDERDVL